MNTLLCRFLILPAALIMPTASVAAQDAPSPRPSAPDIPDNDALAFTGEIVLPDIARFNNLPKRMFLEPDLSLPEPLYYLGEEFPKTFGRLLAGEYEAGLQAEAVYSLRRIAVNKYADTSAYVSDIQRLMNTSPDRDLKRACALALCAMEISAADTDLLAFCTPEWQDISESVETALARWKSPVAVPIWKQRVENIGDFTTLSVRLACQGLASLQVTDSVPVLKNVLQNSQNPFPVRRAAAAAIARLAHDDAITLATEYQSGGIPERLMAVALLGDAESDAALTLLHTMCGDETLAVASQAWETLETLSPERLLDRLDEGWRHPEANVRFVTVRMFRKFPSEPHCEGLQRMLADIHIGVRNAARRSLVELTDSNPELRDGILLRAGRALTDSDSNWQRLEQSLLILGQLKHPPFQKDCVPLLLHEKAEVMVTAAWVLHLMPRHELSEEIAEITLAQRELMKGQTWSEALTRGIHEQMTHLFQHSGLTRQRKVYGLTKDQYNKGSGLAHVARAAGLWALGFFEEGNPDPDLIQAYLERIFDDDPLNPEDDRVRAISVMAIGRMNGRGYVDDLQRAHDRFHTFSIVGQAVRFTMPIIGGPEMPVPEHPNHQHGFWILAPYKGTLAGKAE
ncbi:MAG: hypothetical protein R3C19_01605 [Planctomycetaceae bacterium]